MLTLDNPLVVSSPRQRALVTAELAGLRVDEVSPLLSEWDYGEYEGRPTADIQAERPRWRLFDDGCPGGESVAEATARADHLIARLRQWSGNVLLFGHRDIFRVVAARWLDLPGREGRRFYLATGSLSILGYDHGLDEPVIRVWNDTAR